jgi:hypothetical protein
MTSKPTPTRSKSAKIVRALMTVTGKGHTLFNDRTKTGRSIKVWGWKQEHYEVAMQALAKQGIPSKLVKTASGRYYSGSLRIHTQEAA